MDTFKIIKQLNNIVEKEPATILSGTFYLFYGELLTYLFRTHVKKECKEIID